MGELRALSQTFQLDLKRFIFIKKGKGKYKKKERKKIGIREKKKGRTKYGERG